MKQLWIGMLLSVIVVAASCNAKKSLSSSQAEEPYKIILVGEDTYAIRLERLAKVAGDSTLVSDFPKAVDYLHSYSDKIDLNNSSREMTQRGISNILNSVRLENQTGTKMRFDIWVDRNGFFVASKYDNASTAILSNSQKATVTAQTLTYRMSEDQNAPTLQMGELKISLNNINAFGG